MCFILEQPATTRNEIAKLARKLAAWTTADAEQIMQNAELARRLAARTTAGGNEKSDFHYTGPIFEAPGAPGAAPARKNPFFTTPALFLKLQELPGQPRLEKIRFSLHRPYF